MKLLIFMWLIHVTFAVIFVGLNEAYLSFFSQEKVSRASMSSNACSVSSILSIISFSTYTQLCGTCISVNKYTQLWRVKDFMRGY